MPESGSKNNACSRSNCLAVLGTGSDVGKSIVATALCRCFLDSGIRVAPYKSQNMSNNSGVTPDGLEMGRAQIVQAEASGIPPNVNMNPILLKPTSDKGSQVVLLGRVHDNRTAAEYYREKERLFKIACESLDRLRRDYSLVVMEGAGSCAEVNLMQHDIVNFPMADYAQAPVVLVADIHKGGVFGQIAGTLECLPAGYRDMVKGIIINRFRGDPRLFDDGVSWIEQKTGKPVLGVLPWFSDFKIDSEDSVALETIERMTPKDVHAPSILVVGTPHISNFTDFSALSRIPGVNLVFRKDPTDVSEFKSVILPGSKNTRSDLDWLAATGWRESILRYYRKGGSVFGICGGYQMLGRYVHDPDGLEGSPGKTGGLGLLPIETVLQAPKTTTITSFTWNGLQGTGYEIHMGSTQRFGGAPLVRVTERNGEPCDETDGCMADDGRAAGTYIHGVFDSAGVLRFWLDTTGVRNIEIPEECGLSERIKDYGRLADHFRNHIDMDQVFRIAGL